MNILYAFQGTGNGHASKAAQIVPLLEKYGNVDVLVSGNNFEINMPFPIKYNLKGITFYYNKNGGIDYLKTFLGLKPFRFLNEIRTLNVSNYDLVVSDFEPVSAWASRLIGKEVIGFGHQASFAYNETPVPAKKMKLGSLILRYMAPCDENIGLHFYKYHSNIESPIIQNQIRFAKPQTKKHVTVYLPAISDDHILDVLGRMVEIKFEVFSKYSKEIKQMQNITIYPANQDGFCNSMINSRGVITHAGFETPAEAIYLGKKLICIPIKGQYEQYCNAESLKELNITILEKLSVEELDNLYKWYHYQNPVKIEYENNLDKLADKIINYGLSYNLSKAKIAIQGA
jgi:uncharacterized protein (TIGR00661 family)